MQFKSVTILVAAYICIVQGQHFGCRTPSGDPGSCVPITQCTSLLAISGLNGNEEKLRKSMCGFEGTDPIPMVCCPNDRPPNECLTPDNKQGKCVRFKSCPHLQDMLRAHQVPREAVQFIKKSTCKGSKRDVCCGSSPPFIYRAPTRRRQCTLSAAPPDPSTGCCGIESRVSDRIVGGYKTAIDQYPWMALIEDQSHGLLCAGHLISGRYVLTAGHCVTGDVLKDGTPTYIRLGEYDVSNDRNHPDCVKVAGGGRDCNDGPVVIPIEDIITHSDYKPADRLQRHDIALIRLNRTAPFTEFIRPVCLPQSDVLETDPSDLRLWVSGWGKIGPQEYPNVPHHLDVPYVALDKCQPFYTSKKIPLWENQICAGGERGKDSCNGDSGGALVHQKGLHFETVGIVSFGVGKGFCGTEGVPGVYTKVFNYLDWIRRNIRL